MTIAPPELRLGTRTVPLSRVEFQVLSTLVSSIGEPVDYARLSESLLPGSSDQGVAGYLKTVILRIRRKAASLGADASLLAAVRGCGYVLRG
jgi:DNA-binding response OmpR family regulator